MPIIEGDKKRSFLEQQVITSRNIKSNFIVNYLMGGLNYQIEHHLFPTISRKNLKKVNEIVKKYCLKMKIKYQEQSYLAALKDIFVFLHKVSKESKIVIIN